jgi:hypothetical protein
VAETPPSGGVFYVMSPWRDVSDTRDALIQLGLYELAALSGPRTLEAYQSRRHPCGKSAIGFNSIGSNASVNAGKG